MAARPDENVAKVHVEPVMPLFLQFVSQQADFGPTLFNLLFLELMLARDIIAARGCLCRPKRMLQKLTGIQEKLKYGTYDTHLCRRGAGKRGMRACLQAYICLILGAFGHTCSLARRTVAPARVAWKHYSQVCKLPSKAAASC